MTTEYVPTDKMGNIVSKCIYYSNWNSFAFSVWYVVVLQLPGLTPCTCHPSDRVTTCFTVPLRSSDAKQHDSYAFFLLGDWIYTVAIVTCVMMRKCNFAMSSDSEMENSLAFLVSKVQTQNQISFGLYCFPLDHGFEWFGLSQVLFEDNYVWFGFVWLGWVRRSSVWDRLSLD